MKKICFLLLLIPLAGCAQLFPLERPVVEQQPIPVVEIPAEKLEPTPAKVQVPIAAVEQERFNQALDLLTTTQSLSELRAFWQSYPQNPWGERAKTIILYIEELSLRKEQFEQLRNEQQKMQAENQQLLEKIEQLKKLLIKLEQRPQ